MSQDTPNAPTSSLAKPRRRWGWTILLAIVIFVSGILVGGGLTFKVITSGLKKSFQHPAVLADFITHRMKKQLDLTEEQAVEVRRIILEQQKEFQSLRRQVRPQIEAQMEKTQREITSVLTPEQARKWKNRFSRFLRYWLPLPDEEHP
jgi:hypothetical protein